MINKKFCAFIACVIVLACSCAANAEGLKIGVLSKSGPEEDFNSQAALTWEWTLLGDKHGKDDNFKFYDDLPAMLLALNKGEIDEIDLPQIVAEYVMAHNNNYKISCVMRSQPINFVFGFMKEKVILWQNFNYALRLMSRNGTLQELQEKYLSNPGKNTPEEIKFDSFPNAEKIKIAVTGDIPPIDYTSPDGKAAGFNAAILAEIGRILRVNIETFSINAGARNSALTSGRADGVFWYMINSHKELFDLPENILISDPYYTFNIFLQLRKK